MSEPWDNTLVVLAIGLAHWSKGPLMNIHQSHDEIRAFAKLVAAMLLDGEIDEAGDEFQMTDDDARETLANLIVGARDLLTRYS